MTTYRIGLVLLLVLAAVAMVAGAEPRFEQRCMDDSTREKIRAIMLDSMDKALQEHMAHMFDIWMKDQSDQPARAVKGAQAGVDAYMRARAAALRWTAPTC